jgi:cytochrome c-type biogenesis protein CcmH
MKRLALLTLGVLLLALQSGAQNVAIPDAEQLVGAPRGVALTGALLDSRTQEVASAIRCPVCQGLSIADSPSEMAVNMKAQVRAMLARGYTREQIETYFERSYGQFVLLRPKFQGVNGLVWVLPVLALAFGVFAVLAKVRKLETNAIPPDKVEPPADDAYMARVRELVRGAK